MIASCIGHGKEERTLPAAYRWRHLADGPLLTTSFLETLGVSRYRLSRDTLYGKAARRGRRRYGRQFVYRWSAVAGLLPEGSALPID